MKLYIRGFSFPNEDFLGNVALFVNKSNPFCLLSPHWSLPLAPVCKDEPPCVYTTEAPVAAYAAQQITNKCKPASLAMSWDSCHHSATVWVWERRKENEKVQCEKWTIFFWRRHCHTGSKKGNHFSGSKMFHSNFWHTAKRDMERELWWFLTNSSNQSLFQPALEKKPWVKWYERFEALMLVWKIKDHVSAHQHRVTGI